MIWSSSEIVTVLVFLLPGFVTAGVFHTLTSHPKPNTFGSVIQALVFTVIVQALAVVVKSHVWQWSDDQELLGLLLTSVGVGFVFAVASNLNLVHWPLIKLGLTRENSYSSEWYSGFVHNRCYVILHLKDNRRLYGWPAEWPSDPEIGHFRVIEAEWLTDTATDQSQIAIAPDLSDVQEEHRSSYEAMELLIAVSEVGMVEFVNTRNENIWRKIWQKFRRVLPKGQ